MKHNNEDAVKNAVKLNKCDRDRAFESLRKQGIYEVNKKLICADDDKKLLQERKPQKYKDVSMCGYCNGFFATKYIWKHKRKCPKAESGASFKPMLPLTLLKPENEKPTEFEENILQRFRDNPVGNLCRSDRVVKEVGKRQWAKSIKKDRKVVMTDMRRLSSLIVDCRNHSSQHEFSGEDIFKRGNFTLIETALENLTCKEEGQLSSLKLSLGYILKTAARVMKGVFLNDGEDAKAAEIDIFLTILELNWGHLFAAAQCKMDMRRQEKLRKPAELPLEDDVRKLRDYNVKQIVAANDTYLLHGTYEFNRLRALLVCRLTLFNARRGGEPAKLTLKEWQDAEAAAWIDPQCIERVKDPMEKSLIGRFKLAYQPGKGKKLVPLLIPLDCCDAIKKLIDLRTHINVNPLNPYVFPMTMNSLDHASGWHCVHEVCEAADVQSPNRLTATKMRHRASTLYAMLEVPERERQAFYNHMGHSEEVNRNVYQAPMSLTEICKVGGYLDHIDDMESVGMF